MRNSNTGLCHGTSGSPQESIESLEYGAKVQEIENRLKEEFGHSKYPKEVLSNLGNTERFTEGVIKHIFEGEVNDKGKAVGYHYEGIKNTAGTVVSGTRTTPNANGVYRGTVKVNGVLKNGFSTFFPREISPQQVVNAINQAYANRSFIAGSFNKFLGKTSSGMLISMFLNKNGKIISAFPEQSQ